MITPDPAADARRAARAAPDAHAGGLAAGASPPWSTSSRSGQDGFWGFVNAGAEASMVGAIADWFAVTALFKHPLGLPIPHTALIPQAQGRARPEPRGVRRARTSSRRRSSASGSRRRRSRCGSGSWLAEPAHVRRVVDEVAEVASIGLGKVRDEHVADFVTEALIPRFREEPIAPLAGGLLAEVVRDDLHHGAGRPRRRRAARLAGGATPTPSPRCWSSGRRGGRRPGSTTR